LNFESGVSRLEKKKTKMRQGRKKRINKPAFEKGDPRGGKEKGSKEPDQFCDEEKDRKK